MKNYEDRLFLAIKHYFISISGFYILNEKAKPDDCHLTDPIMRSIFQSIEEPPLLGDDYYWKVIIGLSRNLEPTSIEIYGVKFEETHT